jgi:ABC-type antimicrobial peptide transport system permease subunit
MSSIRTREEKERLVLDLYNQGKTIREIAKEVKMSFRDIGVILNKAVEEKAEELKEQHEEIQQLSVSSQAYKLFSERKTPLEVAIALNLRESEATKFYKEYWKLKQLHNLNMVYEEVEGDLDPFLKLHKLSKAKGMGVKQVVDLLQIANNDLPAVEKRFKRLSNDVSTLQFRKHIDERNLYQLNNQIATTTNILNSLRMSCIRQRREIEKLYNEKARLDAIVTGFKSNNEEYLNKIKQTAEEKVKDVLTNSKLLLKFAIFSIIESLRSSPELYNFVIHGNSNNTPISYGSNYPSLMLLGRQRQQQSFNDTYTALILEESEKLYNKLTTELTNRVITAAATISESSLSLPTYNDNRN